MSISQYEKTNVIFECILSVSYERNMIILAIFVKEWGFLTRRLLIILTAILAAFSYFYLLFLFRETLFVVRKYKPKFRSEFYDEVSEVCIIIRTCK